MAVKPIVDIVYSVTLNIICNRECEWRPTRARKKGLRWIVRPRVCVVKLRDFSSASTEPREHPSLLPHHPLPPHLPYKDSYINVLVFGQSVFKQKVKQFELILFYLFFLISRITGSPTLPCSKAWSLDSRPGYRKKRLKMPLLNFLTGRLSFIPPSELFFTRPWTGEGTVWPGHTAIGCDFLSKNIQEIETEAIIRVFKSIKFTFGIRAAEYAVLQTLWITEDVY